MVELTDYEKALLAGEFEFILIFCKAKKGDKHGR